MRKGIWAAALVTASLGLAACGTTVTTKPTGAGSKPAHLGSTLNVAGTGVTLSRVIDPAAGADQFNQPNKGQHFVGVVLVIRNDGSSALSDDANSDAVVIGTDNQTYTADFDTLAACTNFNSGEYTLAAGQHLTGCVTFALPNGIKVAQVQYGVTNGLNQNTGEWTLTPPK